MRNDAQLQSDVRAELAWDPRVDDSVVRVAASDGVVTLTGSVPSYADKVAAARAAERVLGVRAVANDLAVQIPTKFAQSDTAIATAAADALEWNVEVPADAVKSSVSNGIITLEGSVEWRYQRDAAGRAVRNLTGVRGVINDITVLAKRAAASDVRRNIKEALERRADRTADHIGVETVGGVVTLTGSVSSFGDRRAAEGAAWAAPGVTDVHDELVIG